MAYLEIEEMTTHIYEEDMDVISHGDDAAMMSAIDAAIEEVQGYLTKYDTGKIFAARGKERNPILLLFVKDIAAWHFCNICNAGVDIGMREKRYDRAIEWLRNNQNRQNPNLPAAPERPGRQECRHCGEIAFGSNRKRDNHF
ncbi:DUF1320 domain-containing protein [Bacteroides clarus]|uniref:DUF1320 domain-containing protein n=1 Tax=Bacteroides clarus TaxID=626929 RepID=UPI0024B1C62F|nr:DUF1320 domain-containing protein [Bacteroides clarus]